MERDDRREMHDEHDEHNVGSLDTSMDRCLENHGLWRKRIPQGRTTDRHPHIVYSSLCSDGSSLFRAVSEAVMTLGPTSDREKVSRFVSLVVLHSSPSLRRSLEMH